MSVFGSRIIGRFFESAEDQESFCLVSFGKSFFLFGFPLFYLRKADHSSLIPGMCGGNLFDGEEVFFFG